MAHPLETKARVRREFVQGVSLKMAAEQAGVSYQTARAWRDDAALLGDDWEIARKARQMGAGGDTAAAMAAAIDEVCVLTQFVVKNIKTPAAGKELAPMVQVDALASLMDTLAKCSKLAGLIQPEVSRLSVLDEVMQNLVTYLGADMTALKALSAHLEPFAIQMTQAWAKK